MAHVWHIPRSSRKNKNPVVVITGILRAERLDWRPPGQLSWDQRGILEAANRTTKEAPCFFFPILHGMDMSPKFLGDLESVNDFFWTKMSLRFPNFEPFDVGRTLIGREFRTLGRMFFSTNRYEENCVLLSQKQLQQRTNIRAGEKAQPSFSCFFFWSGWLSFYFPTRGTDRHVECQEYLNIRERFFPANRNESRFELPGILFNWKMGKHAGRNTLCPVVPFFVGFNC